MRRVALAAGVVLALAAAGCPGPPGPGPTPTPTPSTSASASASPSPSTSGTPSASPSSSPSATPSPDVTPTPGPTVWPSPATTGVPAGWTPAQTRTTDLRITTAGALVQDVRIVGADLIVDAPNVTVRRVELVGGRITNRPGAACRNGLLIEDVSVLGDPATTSASDAEAVGPGGYTARRVEISGTAEGFRAGGKASCGAVHIEDSFARVVAPDSCTGDEWHGDGLQGYDAPAITLKNVTLELVENGCGGTAPLFVPAGQGNTSLNGDRVLVKGGGFSYRAGVPGTVTGVRVVDRAWGYGPVELAGGHQTPGCRRVTVDANWQVTSEGAAC